MTRSDPPASLPFAKMHGAGNDFAIFWSRGDAPVLTPALARAVACRRFGVGCDQVVEVRPGSAGGLKLVFFNADGSVSGACGNATRCIAAAEMNARDADALDLVTDFGMLKARRDADGAVWVNMGRPVHDPGAIPLSATEDTDTLPLPGAPAAVGMGNPHCVHIVDDADAVDVAGRGAEIERHPLFPARTNVEFASLCGEDALRLRVWERGAGITPACGSGACATAVVAHRRGLTGPHVTLAMDGGTLEVRVTETGVWLTGPVALIYSGELSPDFLQGLQ
mgnify:CR=1 FL=1